jgi:hypothetical protein
MTSLYFQLQGRLARMRDKGELPPGEYSRNVSPREYRQVLGELYQQTNGWKADPPDVVTHRLKNLLIAKQLYTSESCL